MCVCVSSQVAGSYIQKEYVLDCLEHIYQSNLHVRNKEGTENQSDKQILIPRVQGNLSASVILVHFP